MNSPYAGFPFNFYYTSYVKIIFQACDFFVIHKFDTQCAMYVRFERYVDKYFFFSQQHIRFHLRKNAPLTKKIIEKPQPFTQGENLKTSFYDTYMHRRVIGWHKKHIEIECFEMLRR